MKKWPGNDYTYCSAGSCAKKNQCFRWIGHYLISDNEQRIWFLSPEECQKNDYSEFVEIQN
jgi:hypothetical protein